MLGRLKFDLDVLANEMLSQIPNWVFESDSTTFLDPAMGGGQFLRAVAAKLRKYGHSEENIASRLFGMESFGRSVRFAKKKGTTGTLWVGGLKDLEWMEKMSMKFDVVIGNPPYQMTDSKAKRWTLWDQFLAEAITLGSIIAFVIPQSITSPGNLKKIRKHSKVINLDVDKHFNVGSTFCYIIYDHSHNGDTTIIDKNIKHKIDIRSIDFLPNDVNPNTLHLMQTLYKRKHRIWKRGELHTSNKGLFDTHGAYDVFHTNAQTLQTNVVRSEKNMIRVAVSLSGYPKFQVIRNGYCSQATFWTEFSSISAAKTFANKCNGAMTQEILTTFKWSGWNSKEIISLL